jgi:hypothetical protein
MKNLIRKIFDSKWDLGLSYVSSERDMEIGTIAGGID